MFSLHEIAFHGDRIDTCVTDDPSVVTRWIVDVQRAHLLWLNRLVVGLDIEWRPNLEPGVVHPVAILQLCVGRSCLVFQILHAEYVPGSLHAFLANLYFTFVGVGIEDDAAKLSRDFGLAVARTVDLRTLAMRKWRNPSFGYMGLKKLVKVILRKDLEKPKEITLSQWDDKALTARQVEYACLDAFVTFELGMVLQAWSVGRARVGWCAGANRVVVPSMIYPIMIRQVGS
ncbi:Werner Syndrome-like exonuclease [Rhodamnia argentea]|uniref:Werner Syndrome-like exonuclease n=1 Tax=Rhodamnia argentea TaxID=178133 RepID=A0A8B8PKQ0_9MYRT|nr:Werner Syndrome-like exonuclease [Rhodamnia argentea]